MYLIELMNARHMSRTDLSDLSGVPESTLRDILTGKAQLDRCEARRCTASRRRWMFPSKTSCSAIGMSLRKPTRLIPSPSMRRAPSCPSICWLTPP